MAKVLTRLMMGLIFVFVTISSPVHAHAIAPQSAKIQVETHHMEMSSMDEDCAKAMAEAAAAEEAKSHDSGQNDSSQKGGDCCDVGCKCPLSHCPATPVALFSNAFQLIYHGQAAIPEPAEDILPAYLADTLKRPPRA